MEQIIKQIADKFGVALEWAEANVPEIISRYVKWEIFSNAVQAVAFLLAVILFAVFVVVKYDQFTKTKKDNILFESGWRDNSACLTDVGIGIVIVGCVACVFFLIVCFATLHDMFEWIYIPEIKLLGMLK